MGAFVVEELVGTPVVVLEPEPVPELDLLAPHAARSVIISAAVTGLTPRCLT